jgi:DNA-binding NarL/FixJ family response regulator
MSVNATDAIPARVLIVEDDAPTRDALCAALNARADIRVVGSADSRATGLALIAEPHDVVLTDLGLPDGSGLDVVRAVASAGRSVAAVLSIFGDETTVLDAIEAGASGYLLKDDADVGEAVLRAAAGESPVSPPIAVHLLRRLRPAAPTDPALTPREIELLECFARGHSYKEAALRLGISYHTVTDHVKAVYRKLAVRSRGEAVFAAVRNGIIRLERTA